MDQLIPIAATVRSLGFAAAHERAPEVTCRRAAFPVPVTLPFTESEAASPRWRSASAGARRSAQPSAPRTVHVPVLRRS